MSDTEFLSLKIAHQKTLFSETHKLNETNYLIYFILNRLFDNSNNMNEDDVKKFIIAKGELLENFEALEVRLGACQDQGLIDTENMLYYEVDDLITASSEAKDFEELNAIIFRGQEVERNVDAFLAQLGYSTMSLEWPKL